MTIIRIAMPLVLIALFEFPLAIGLAWALHLFCSDPGFWNYLSWLLQLLASLDIVVASAFSIRALVETFNSVLIKEAAERRL